MVYYDRKKGSTVQILIDDQDYGLRSKHFRLFQSHGGLNGLIDMLSGKGHVKIRVEVTKRATVSLNTLGVLDGHTYCMHTVTKVSYKVHGLILC